MKQVSNGRIFAEKIFDKKGLSNGRIDKKLNNLNIFGFEKL